MISSIIGTQGWSTRVPDARVGAHLSGIPDSTSALPRARVSTSAARRDGVLPADTCRNSYRA